MAKEIVATYGELIEAHTVERGQESAFSRVLKVRVDEQLRYHIMKLQRLSLAEVKHFEARRDELIAELGEERPPTGAERAQRGPAPVMAVKREHMAEYTTRVKELLAVKTTITYGPITREMVKDYPDIAGNDLIAFGPMFELDPATDAKA